MGTFQMKDYFHRVFAIQQKLKEGGAIFLEMQ